MALNTEFLESRQLKTAIQIKQLIDDIQPLELRLREMRAELNRLKNLQGGDVARLRRVERKAGARHDSDTLTLPGLNETIGPAL